MEAIQRLQTTPKQVIQYFPYLLGKTWDDSLGATMRDLGVTEFATTDANNSIVVLRFSAYPSWHILIGETNVKLSLFDVYVDFLTTLLVPFFTAS